MRYLILSDIHSNLEALEACLSRAGELDYTDAFCCGDIVGYGPNPREAIERVRQLKVQTVRGNHDRVAAGIDDDDNFNPYAREAAYWTRRALPEPLRGYLKSLPTGPLGVRSDAQLVHGALTHEDDYIFNERDAESSFELTRKPITFFGHSHFQVVFSLGPTGGPAVEPVDDSGADCRIRLRPGGRFPHQSGFRRTTSRRGSSCSVRRLGHGCRLDRVLSGGVSCRTDPGEDEASSLTLLFDPAVEPRPLNHPRSVAEGRVSIQSGQLSLEVSESSS